MVAVSSVVGSGDYILNCPIIGGWPNPNSISNCFIIAGKWLPGGDTIKAVRIIVYLVAFAVVMGVAVAIALLSVIVAPAGTKSGGLAYLAVALGGLGVAGGIVYLAEKLINLAKGAGYMLAELIVEKFKERERRIGEERGRVKNQREWLAWYERQQAAQRDGRPFNEPPPGYSSENRDDE